MKYVTLILTIILMIPGLAKGSSADTLQIIASDSGSADSLQPSVHIESDPLTFSAGYVVEDSGPQRLYCPRVTRKIYLKFDLSQVDFAIDKARLELSPVATLPSDFTDLQIEGSADTWNKSSLMWSTRPETLYPLIENVSLNNQNNLVWSDATGNQWEQLSEWLESQRLSDGTATLSLTMPIAMGCWPQLPNNPTEFLLSIGNEFSQTPPVLVVASADTNLPDDLQTTAVTLSSRDTYALSVSITLLVTLLLLALATIIALKRRSAQLK